MKVLALDSSGLVASVALIEDGVLLGEYSTNFHKTHSTTLLPMLDELMRMLSLDIRDAGIDAIAVAKGPGSFTGLRIGTATAKGLAFVLGVPIVPVSTLAGLAYNLWGTDGIVCPLMDARRNQTYTAIYRFADQVTDTEERSAGHPADPHIPDRERRLKQETLVEPCAVDISDIVQKINDRKDKVIFMGDGVPVFADYIREHCVVPYCFAPAHANRQRAASVGALAMTLMAEKNEIAIPSDQFAPDYLRLSQAERERIEKETAERTG